MQPAPPIISIAVVGLYSGKSTLIGRLMVDTGKVSPHDYQTLIAKHQQYNPNAGFSYLVHTSNAERYRGLTMYPKNIYIQYNQHQLSLIDTPSHKDFLPNTFAGIFLADAVMLVVSARKGDFESSLQYNQQLIIASVGFGITQFIICITALGDQQWDQVRKSTILCIRYPQNWGSRHSGL